MEEVYVFFVEVRINDLIWDFIRIELVKFIILYIGKRYDRVSFGLIFDNGLDCININFFFYKVRI